VSVTSPEQSGQSTLIAMRFSHAIETLVVDALLNTDVVAAIVMAPVPIIVKELERLWEVCCH
jgi:hypothetical protein